MRGVLPPFKLMPLSRLGEVEPAKFRCSVPGLAFLANDVLGLACAVARGSGLKPQSSSFKLQAPTLNVEHRSSHLCIYVLYNLQ